MEYENTASEYGAVAMRRVLILVLMEYENTYVVKVENGKPQLS